MSGKIAIAIGTAKIALLLWTELESQRFNELRKPKHEFIEEGGVMHALEMVFISAWLV